MTPTEKSQLAHDVATEVYGWELVDGLWRDKQTGECVVAIMSSFSTHLSIELGTQEIKEIQIESFIFSPTGRKKTEQCMEEMGFKYDFSYSYSKKYRACVTGKPLFCHGFMVDENEYIAIHSAALQAVKALKGKGKDD